MKEILDTILGPGSQPADFAALPSAGGLPRRDRARRRGRSCRGPGSPGRRTRAWSLHLDQVPLPDLGPGEALVAVMASAINYNTVWSSIFELASTFAFLRKYGRLSELTRRHHLPYHVLGSDLAGVVLRTGPGVNRVAPGRRGGRALPVGRAGGRGRAQRHHARPGAADLGVRDQLRRPGLGRPVKTNQLMPKPGPPDLGGGGQPGPGQLHRVPAAGLATTARR